MSLRLHAAAHHSECFPRLAIFHHEAGNDGVERPLARRVNVGMTSLHREEFTAILKHESKSWHYNAATHAAIIALY